MIFLASETYAASLTSAASETSMASSTLKKKFHQKKLTDLDDFTPPGTKMTNSGSFLWMGSLKSKFLLIYIIFLSKTVEAGQCYFFERKLDKLKCPNLEKYLDR